jgi:hypothetical protein
MTLSGLVHIPRNVQLDRFIQISFQISTFLHFFKEISILVPVRDCVV